MKIIITGATGQLGTDCQHILQPNHNLIALSWKDLNISDSNAVHTLVTAEKPDVIINCAAYTAVDACETSKVKAWQANAEGAKYLAMEATTVNARFVHISTDYVFDGTKTVPEYYLENDQTNPLSEYGKSKLAGETAVLEHCHNSVILRTAWLYSAHGNNFLKTMLRLATSDPKRELKVVNDQYGSPTWSLPLAKQIEKLLESDICGIIHTTNEGYCTWFETACYFLDALGQPYNIRPCTTAEYPTPAHRPANSILENGVLKQHGINIFSDWRESIDEFAKMYKEKI